MNDPVERKALLKEALKKSISTDLTGINFVS